MAVARKVETKMPWDRFQTISLPILDPENICATFFSKTRYLTKNGPVKVTVTRKVETQMSWNRWQTISFDILHPENMF